MKNVYLTKVVERSYMSLRKILEDYTVKRQSLWQGRTREDSDMNNDVCNSIKGLLESEGLDVKQVKVKKTGGGYAAVATIKGLGFEFELYISRNNVLTCVPSDAEVVHAGKVARKLLNEGEV